MNGSGSFPCQNRAELVTNGTLKGSSVPGPGAASSSRTVGKAAKLLSWCGGFEKLNSFPGMEVLDRSSSSGQSPEKQGTTLCTPNSPPE